MGYTVRYPVHISLYNISFLLFAKKTKDVPNLRNMISGVWKPEATTIVAVEYEDLIVDLSSLKQNVMCL